MLLAIWARTTVNAPRVSILSLNVVARKWFSSFKLHNANITRVAPLLLLQLLQYTPVSEHVSFRFEGTT